MWVRTVAVMTIKKNCRYRGILVSVDYNEYDVLFDCLYQV